MSDSGEKDLAGRINAGRPVVLPEGTRPKRIYAGYALYQVDGYYMAQNQESGQFTAFRSWEDARRGIDKMNSGKQWDRVGPASPA